MKTNIINNELIEKLAVNFKNIATNRDIKVEPLDITTIKVYLRIARTCLETIDQLVKEKGVLFGESELNNPKEITLYPNSKPIPILDELNSRLLPQLDKIKHQLVESVRVGDIILDIITEIGYAGMLRMALNIIYSYTETGMEYEQLINPYKLEGVLDVTNGKYVTFYQLNFKQL